jgi:hypothetical protein
MTPRGAARIAAYLHTEVGGVVRISLVYVLMRRVLHVVMLFGRSRDFKELEIVVLRHELSILQRRTTRPPMTLLDRVFSRRGEPALATDTMAVVRRHASDAAPLASPDRGLAMDVRWPQRPTVHSTEVRDLIVLSRERIHDGDISRSSTS